MIQSNKENRTEKRRQTTLRKSADAKLSSPHQHQLSHTHILAPELPLVAHTEPQRKSRRLGFSSSTAPLVPRSLSLTFDPRAAPQSRSHRFTLSHGSPQDLRRPDTPACPTFRCSASEQTSQPDKRSVTKPLFTHFTPAPTENNCFCFLMSKVWP
ncbi:hypothetical protein WMY93_003716 [Mugilogobius chulae]|uniref:Uncharacterized protein n=1 Tax=Mugilogobius chulae TaxID=88201 RepID=A0AAW0PYB9_9GOBI